MILSLNPLHGMVFIADLATNDPLKAGNLSALLANVSFLLLFLAMTLYWIDLAFFKKNTSAVPNQALEQISNAGSTITSEGMTQQPTLAIALNPGGQPNLANFGKYAIYSSNVALFLLLCVRWQESGHFPLSNLYESLMFLSWSCTSIYIFLILRPNLTAHNVSWNATSTGSSSEPVFTNLLLGSLLAPSALFLNAFATFSLPKEMQQAGPLVPALQSNWLMMHVTVMIISYSALMLGSLLAIAYLIFSKVSATKKLKMNPVRSLDYLSYRIIGIGFPFLTIGILSGAVWANEAWGSYWSWDPKETWALLTWLVFAIYLHTRLQKGWEGEKPAMLASLGFVVVWICYLGVNLLGEGLHSYGFLT